MQPHERRQVQVMEAEEVRLFPKYKVIFLNDNKTTMQFVIHCLNKFFNYDINQSRKIMISIHNAGQGVVGVFQKEIAEFKQEQVISLARGRGFPLCVIIEPE